MIVRPTLLDGCCCAGLGADGYTAVGIRVAKGIDVTEQPNYPYPFQRADVFPVLSSDEPEQYSALHFSFPCQEHTDARHLRAAQNGKSRFGDLLTPGLALLRKRWNHKPWVVENVDDRTKKVRAIMAPREGESLIMLCGSMFGLQVQRHRLFLANFPLRQPVCDHSTFERDPVSGRPRPWGVYHVKGDAIPAGGRTARDEEHGRQVMGSHRLLPWHELKEGFPPAYTSFVGADLLHHLHSHGRTPGSIMPVGWTVPERTDA